MGEKARMIGAGLIGGIVALTGEQAITSLSIPTSLYFEKELNQPYFGGINNVFPTDENSNGRATVWYYDDQSRKDMRLVTRSVERAFEYSEVYGEEVDLKAKNVENDRGVFLLPENPESNSLYIIWAVDRDGNKSLESKIFYNNNTWELWKE